MRDRFYQRRLEHGAILIAHAAGRPTVSLRVENRRPQRRRRGQHLQFGTVLYLMMMGPIRMHRDGWKEDAQSNFAEEEIDRLKILTDMSFRVKGEVHPMNFSAPNK